MSAKLDLQVLYNVPSVLPQPRACFCRGPQNGDPVCPCAMPAYREREAGKRALEILRRSHVKPRIRVKAIMEPI